MKLTFLFSSSSQVRGAVLENKREAAKATCAVSGVITKPETPAWLRKSVADIDESCDDDQEATDTEDYALAEV